MAGFRFYVFCLCCLALVSCFETTKNNDQLLSKRLLDSYSQFRLDPTYENLKVIDESGLEGALLLIGTLELDADWFLVKERDKEYILLASVHLSPGEREIQGVRARAVTEVLNVNFRLFNSYLIAWARGHPKVKRIQRP